MNTVKTLLATTIVAALAVSACGSTAKLEPTTQKGDGWQIDFPNKVTTSTQDSNGLTITIHLARTGDDAYSVSEFALPAGGTFDLDGGVDGAISGMSGTDNVASVELANSDPITTADGFEGRSYQAKITGDDGKKATSNGVIVNHNGNIVQATMLDVGTNNTDDSAAFLASLTFD